jgi:hypothetical protein
MKLRLFGMVVAAGLAFGVTGIALAAPNPSGTGLPDVECGDPGATSSPAGFATSGFAHAEDQYSATSQYDVACYQLTSAGR